MSALLEFRAVSIARGVAKRRGRPKGKVLPYEDAIIRKYYPTEAADGCWRRMDRSIAWIRARAQVLGVPYTGDKLLPVGLMGDREVEWLSRWLVRA